MIQIQDILKHKDVEIHVCGRPRTGITNRVVVVAKNIKKGTLMIDMKDLLIAFFLFRSRVASVNAISYSSRSPRIIKSSKIDLYYHEIILKSWYLNQC